MVSRHASQGEIQVLFSHAWAQWLIKRNLKSTKAGNDSVTSTLFRVGMCSEEIEEKFSATYWTEIICTGAHIADLLPALVLDEVIAQWQKEIDGMILDLLPSREVTLSSCVLMQESDNVFDMTPALRITVFKQLFDLLDMDHVRDHLAELKKTTQLRRQVLQEDATVQQQFSSQYLLIRSLVEQLHALPTTTYTQPIEHRLQQPFLKDIVQYDLQEMRLEWSFLQWYDAKLTSILLETLDTQLQENVRRQGQAQQLMLQQEELKKSQQTLHQEQEQLTIRGEQITWKLDDLDVEHITSLQNKLQDIDTQIDLLWQKIPVQKAQEYGLVFTNITQTQQLMYAHITEAKQLQQQRVLCEEKEQTLRDQSIQLQEQMQEIEQQLVRLADDKSRSQAFRCDKIQDDCPYVSAIRKVNTSALDEQIMYFQQQLQKLRDIALPACIEKLQTLEDEIKDIDSKILAKKQLFTNLWRKDLEEVFRRADELYHERKITADALRSLQNRLEESKLLVEEQQKILQRTQQISSELDRLHRQREETKTLIDAFDIREINKHIQELKQYIQQLQRFEQLTGQIAGLVEQYVERQQQIRELQDKEVLLKDLLQIFQKELLIVVLQDFLPVLEEVINSYLQQVVSFSLRFELPKTMQEQIELAIRIIDEKWQRAVKSLSWWQRAVLRLCRILAVSTLFKQEYLLLDETINSLDHEAIGRVAELLDGFVKQREVTFYLVTHATQIQEMSFWRRIIELDPIL